MNEEYRIMNVESGKNIPVLRTLGYYAISYSTKITGALHLGFQTTGTAINDTMTTPRNILSGNRRIWNEKPAAAPRNILTCIQWICRTSNGEPAAALRNTLSGNRRICRTSNGEPAAAPRNTLTCIQWICRTSNGDTAAAPRNICRTAYHSSERKVHPASSADRRTETLNGNVEYKIRKSEVVPKASLREKSEVVPKASLREKPEVGSWKREARSTKLCRRHPCGGREKMRG